MHLVLYIRELAPKISQIRWSNILLAIPSIFIESVKNSKFQAEDYQILSKLFLLSYAEDFL